MENKKIKNYNIGLDIGVTSVGWAVTDINNNLLKRNSRNMWGVRLFDEAQKAEVARTFRAARRRLDRRKERIKLLNNLMYEDIIKQDAGFFAKLKESSLILKDRTIKDNKYNLFNDEEFNDVNFYHKYPTMYHLRMDLINSKEQMDIRLVYLAIHHIIKYRGNFLYENTEFKNSGVEISEKIKILLDWLQEEYNLNTTLNIEEIENILSDTKKSKAERKDNLITSFNYDSSNKSVLTNMIGALLGGKFNISKAFGIDKVENDSISFSEELNDELEADLGENYNILITMQEIFSWVTLQNVLQKEAYISQAFINKYNKYHNDLYILKNLYKLYIPEKYNEMFRTESYDKINYFTYTKNSKNCSKDAIHEKIKKDFSICKNNSDKNLEYVLSEIDNKTFLDKTNTTDNGAIPYQLHKDELEKILENQSKYYNSLNENKDKIISLLEFRIPYYVGPLNNNSRFAWLEKINNEKIYPWNFDKVVDINASAEKFILRMIKKCTYLIDEYVMPKNSLLYTEYCVLNELNNIKINDKRISKETKQLVIEQLFKTCKKVTLKRFKEFLLETQQYDKIDSITGLAISNEFMSSMGSYIDMKDIFGYINETNYEMIEEIIRWITIFEDKKILKDKIAKKYDNITNDQIKKILKKRYTGWSSLSKKLLVGLKSYDNETIMDKLRNTNYNFMQIITKKEFGFDKKLEELMPKLKNNKIKYKEDVSILYGSPALKRGIWQAIQIVEEIVDIMKCEPDNIYIEFARGEDKNKNRKDARAQQLLKIYENIQQNVEDIRNFDFSVYKELKGKSKEKDFNEKLYLYFLQNGKCLYTQTRLDLSNLSNYQVDHIMPQSYIKDDSISNKALVLSSANQNKKANLLLSNEIINKNREWWMQLKKLGLMTDKKFHNLTRTEITEYDEIKFINRQLVETRQITKHVTNLLINAYKNTKVFSINANANHNFRENYNLYKNRNINDYHHAHDAYITSIIGNFANKHFTYDKREFEYTEYIKEYKKKDGKKRNVYGLLMNMINNSMTDEEIAKIRNTILNYKDCYVTKKLEELTGEFYNQTLNKKGQAVLKIKSNKSTEDYGGYSGENKAYYSIISYLDKKGKEDMKIVGIPVQISYMITNKQITLEEYLKSLGMYNNCIILKEKVLKHQPYLNEYNEQLRLVSDDEIRMNKQLVVNEKVQQIVYLMNNPKRDYEEQEYVEDNLDYVFDYLLEKIKAEYKTFDNIFKNLTKNKEKYFSLESNDKIRILNGIIDMLHTGQGDLSKLGLGNRSGRMNGKTFDIKRLQNMKFIDNSITGMYKRGYRINGLENSNNK